MGEATVRERLYELLIREFELEPELVRPEATLRDELELDSLDAMDLIAMVDKQLGLRVDEEVVLNITTVGELTQYLDGLAR